MRFPMNHRASLALVLTVVLIGSVHCDEKKVNKQEKKPTNGGQQQKNSTSSVVIENKVQNVSVGYKNDHGKLSKVPAISDNKTISNSVIISTSKETRLIPAQEARNNLSTIFSVKQSPNETVKPSQKPTSKPNATRYEPSYPHFVPTAPPNLDPAKIQVSNIKNGTFSSRSYSPTVPTKHKNHSSQIDLERMEVKEMKYKKDVNDNNKFKLYFVNDEGGESNSRQAKSSQMIEMTFSNKNTDQSDWMPSNGNGYNKKTTYNQQNSGYSSYPKNSSPYLNGTQGYVSKPSREKYDVTTFSPQLSHGHKKFNSSQLISRLKAEKSEKKTPHESSSQNGLKQYKHVNPPNKKYQHQKNDSTLSQSKSHYNIAQPDSPHKKRHTLRQNQPNYNGMLSSPSAQNDSRVAYIYPSTGGLTDYATRKPENGRGPGAIQKPSGTDDLYHLDQLQPSGTSHEHSRAHVMYETKEVHIPYPVKIEKKVPWPIHIQVDRPVPVHVDKPYPVHVEKKVPVPVKVHVPHPYPVEKQVPVPMKIPVDVPRPVKVDKPVPYVVEKPVPIQIIKQVKMPVDVPVDVPVPYKVAVQVEKRVPFFVKKKVPFEVKVPVERPHFIEEKKTFEVPVERPYPVTVEKKIPVPVQVVEFIKIPYSIKIPTEQTIKDFHNFGDFASSSNLNEQRASSNNQKSHHDSRKSSDFRHGRSDEQVSVEKQTMLELPVTLPSMISVEFPAVHGKEPTVEAVPSAESPQTFSEHLQYQQTEQMWRQQQQKQAESHKSQTSQPNPETTFVSQHREQMQQQLQQDQKQQQLQQEQKQQEQLQNSGLQQQHMQSQQTLHQVNQERRQQR